jgi:hypothetical protein
MRGEDEEPAQADRGDLRARLDHVLGLGLQRLPLERAGEGDEALQLAPDRAPELFPGLDPTVGVPIAEIGGEVLQISRQVPPLECLPHRDVNRVQASGEIRR